MNLFLKPPFYLALGLLTLQATAQFDTFQKGDNTIILQHNDGKEAYSIFFTRVLESDYFIVEKDRTEGYFIARTPFNDGRTDYNRFFRVVFLKNEIHIRGWLIRHASDIKSYDTETRIKEEKISLDKNIDFREMIQFAELYPNGKLMYDNR